MVDGFTGLLNVTLMELGSGTLVLFGSGTVALIVGGVLSFGGSGPFPPQVDNKTDASERMRIMTEYLFKIVLVDLSIKLPPLMKFLTRGIIIY